VSEAPTVAILRDPDSPFAGQADALAARFQLPLVESVQSDFTTLLLIFDQAGLGLHAAATPSDHPLRIDFTSGSLDYRRRHGGGAGEHLAKAVGVRGGFRPQLFDATGGLGTDAFLLASLGSEVTLCERSPVMAALLFDALARARAQPECAAIVERITLLHADARQQLASSGQHDVIYLDPMFPPRSKSALPRKAMVQLQQLVGHDEDADQLLPLALERARYRVVIKRPRHAPLLAGQTASYSLSGPTCRFDVHSRQRLPSKKDAESSDLTA